MTTTFGAIPTVALGFVVVPVAITQQQQKSWVGQVQESQAMITAAKQPSDLRRREPPRDCPTNAWLPCTSMPMWEGKLQRAVFGVAQVLWVRS